MHAPHGKKERDSDIANGLFVVLVMWHREQGAGLPNQRMFVRIELLVKNLLVADRRSIWTV